MIFANFRVLSTYLANTKILIANILNQSDKEYMSNYDAVIIGSGPNGLTAAVELARNGAKVLVIEGAENIGGGTRVAELTLPGFKHDYCSAVHPMGELSPYLKTLPLEKYGLTWIHPPASVAHPLDGEAAVILKKSVEETGADLGLDAKAWARMVKPFIGRIDDLLADSLGPFSFPKNPFLLARFGMKAVMPATTLAKLQFKGHRARALFAGCAAHSLIPLEKPLSAAIGLVFAITGHVVDWPVPKGGSKYITGSLAAYLEDLGGEIQTSTWIKDLNQLPPAKVYLFDTDPLQVAQLGADLLPSSYTDRLKKYNFGPGAFKVDWALDGPIPWSDPRVLEASTVHLGGKIEELAAGERDAWYGRHNEAPFVLLCQQSQFDSERAPAGKHTGYAYCHVPNGSDRDMTEIIVNQVERFAPGFRDIILDTHVTYPSDFAQYNLNFVGGAITGGAADVTQLYTRPVARLDPYSTPHPQIFICSASTPPGGGVHGMCGYHAAKSALRRMDKLKIKALTDKATVG